MSLLMVSLLWPTAADANRPVRSRPAPSRVHTHPRAGHPPPTVYPYRPYYTRWYTHPYQRHVYVLPRPRVVVRIGSSTEPWTPTWVPPRREGWVWVPGRWLPGRVWAPGHWRPVGAAPSGFVYVPGYWAGQMYVEGFWRTQARRGWVWVEGRYGSGGRWVPGGWQPLQEVPAGYVWEHGFFDGEQYVDGFWRPVSRSGHRWVAATFTPDGTFSAGYWQPTETRPGHLWVPGWFDGVTWVEGYWEPVQAWQARADEPVAPVEGTPAPTVERTTPLAIPVEPP